MSLLHAALVALTVAAAPPPAPSEADIVSGYEYLLAPLLALREQQLDLQAGVPWNGLRHRGTAPDTDALLSDAWLAVDAASCTLLTWPPIADRYATAQVVSLWGDTVANASLRTHPYGGGGPFAFCLRGARVPLPAGATRIDLPSGQARLLVQIALAADAAAAAALQSRLTLTPTGTPAVALPPPIPAFGPEALPGAEVFDGAAAILDHHPDPDPAMDAARAAARRVAAAAAEPAQRARIELVVRQQAIPQVRRSARAYGRARGAWLQVSPAGRYDGDARSRAAAALAYPWANREDEVVLFRSEVDAAGAPLDGASTYHLTFPADQDPGLRAFDGWSLTVVDAQGPQVIDAAPARRVVAGHTLPRRADGSVSVTLAPTLPPDTPAAAWLPTPSGHRFALLLRFFRPSPVLQAGQYVPPAAQVLP